MKIEQEYKDLIEKTVVRSRISEQEKEKLYKPIEQYVQSRLPKKLYRYRQCNELSLSALLNDELWFSSAQSMNDCFDARLFVNQALVRERINNLKSDDYRTQSIEGLLGIPEDLGFLQYRVPEIDRVIQEYRKKSIRDLEKDYERIINDIEESVYGELSRITEQIREITKFACFSETIESAMMWGHYADSAKGFALEYEFSNMRFEYQDDLNRAFCNLFPVLYVDSQIDGTNYAIDFFKIHHIYKKVLEKSIPINWEFINSLLPVQDEFMGTKLAIIKSLEWRPEKEWRLFFSSNDMALQNKPHVCIKKKPVAVYLGRSISSINQSIICNIAKEKNIKVYKMDFNCDSRRYCLRADELL